MVKILFVCHGNICRSPMAQCVMQDLADRAGLSDRFLIDSRATSREEIGNPPHFGTVRRLKQAGVPLLPHRASQISWDDYCRFDYIIGMDDWNIRNLRRMLRDDPDGKVYKLLSFAGSGRDIADPWYTDDFDAAYDRLEEAILAIDAPEVKYFIKTFLPPLGYKLPEQLSAQA